MRPDLGGGVGDLGSPASAGHPVGTDGSQLNPQPLRLSKAQSAGDDRHGQTDQAACEPAQITYRTVAAGDLGAGGKE